jgi:serine protease Do
MHRLFFAILMASSAAAASGDTIKLSGGTTVPGTIVKQNTDAVWIDVGPSVLRFDHDVIDAISIDEVTEESRRQVDGVFFTAGGLAELSPRSQARRIGPSVVKVSTPGGLGSGVIIDPQGYLITNAHVIQGETALRVTVWFPEADGRLRRVTVEDVEIIAVNSHTDLALLKMTHPEDGEFFHAAPLEEREEIEVGQPVFAIGNPLGLERTLSQGVLSTRNRNVGGLAYIQTDTSINPGNSGGPLFNLKGEVIGITNMTIPMGEGLGFAIPTRYVKDFVRNRDAFSYDKTNPNSGHAYHDAPPRRAGGTPPQLAD